MKNLIFLVFSLTFILQTPAQDYSWIPKFKVKVNVTGPPSTASTVKGYLIRELRKISDIVISDNDCHFRIGCVFVEEPTGVGVTRYSMSLVVTSKYPAAGIINLLRSLRKINYKTLGLIR